MGALKETTGLCLAQNNNKLWGVIVAATTHDCTLHPCVDLCVVCAIDPASCFAVFTPPVVPTTVNYAYPKRRRYRVANDDRRCKELRPTYASRAAGRRISNVEGTHRQNG
eukprot:GHVU01092730.1.p3 GENE.GHVU01092730.1~~GHVU01092730.1.p3  ORF type:complete len:110 (+),score=7.84 GHVU01092730.1:1082-1411(+)